MAIQIEMGRRERVRVFLYGAPGSMKTTAAAAFPKPVFLQDGDALGADFTGKPRVRINTVGDVREFLALGKELAKFETVVLDDFSTWVKRMVEAKGKTGDPRRAYKDVNDELLPEVRKILALGKNVVFTGHHQTEKEIYRSGDKSLERAWVHPTLPDALEIYVLSLVDVVGYCYNNGACHALVVERADARLRVTAKRRVGIECPDCVAMGPKGEGLAKALLG